MAEASREMERQFSAAEVRGPLRMDVPVPPRPGTSTGLPFARRRASLQVATAPPIASTRPMSDLVRPPPPESRLLGPRGQSHDPYSPSRESRPAKPQHTLTKSWSAYLDDAFRTGSREVNSAKDRIRSEAIVLAEVKTNVIVNDEFTFLTDLSYHLSQQYQRPVSSIVVTLQHGACMLFAGSFEPAYIMAVFAPPLQVQPAINRRNAALIQTHVEESIGVPRSRGCLRFVAVPEENAAWNGLTTAGEIAELTGRQSIVLEDDGAQSGLKRALSARKRLSMKKSLTAFRGQLPELTPPDSSEEERLILPALRERSNRHATHGASENEAPLGLKPAGGRAKRRRSLATWFGRSSSGRAESLAMLLRR